MANKHVTNPCSNSGVAVADEHLSAATITAKGVTQAFCPACDGPATVNKKNKAYRKHTGAVNESE